MNLRNIFLIVLLISFITSCSDKKTYLIEFDNVNGLKEKAEVIFKGKEIGSVEKIELNENRKIIVSLKIDNNFTLPENSKFIMISRDFIGTKAIEIKDSNFTSAPKSDNIITGDIENRSIIDSLANKAIELLKTSSSKGFTKQDSILIELRRLNNNLEDLKP